METPQWFESWFDSPLYDQLYANRDEREAARLVSWIHSRFPSEKYPQVLDMGCGRGRHALFLAEKGYHVTGVDLSPLAISRAMEKAKNGTSHQQKKPGSVTFEIGDMRTWSDGPFDLVCNLFTSFGYFGDDSDNLSVLRNMVKNLSKGGYLIMDYMNPEFIKKHLVPREHLVFGEMKCEITRAIEDDVVIKTILFRHGSGEQNQRYQERVKLYGRQWFCNAFRELGLDDPVFAGDYDGSDYDPGTSSRLISAVKNQAG